MSAARVYYRERQRLVTADLRDEQEYLLAIAGRHHLAPHQWGVVRGLRILRSIAGGFMLTPGVAIDGYGREILVGDSVALGSPDLNACQAVVLYYCEFDAQVWPDRKCEDIPAPRIAQRFVWGLLDEFQARDDDQPIEAARAAGRFIGSAPWPVLVGRIGEACLPAEDERAADLPVDYSSTRYVRHRAAVVKSPTGRARVQLGLSSLMDVYRFLLSTADGTSLVRRIAIDRDRDIQVWRPLRIVGPIGVGKTKVAADKVLVISTANPGGVGARVRFQGQIDPVSHTLSGAIVDVSDRVVERLSAIQAPKKFAATKPLDLQVPFAGSRMASVSLFDTENAPVPFGRTPRHGEGRQPLAVAMELPPAGGRLQLDKADASVADSTGIACGDVNRTRAGQQAVGTPVVQLRPAAEITPNPLAREIFAITTSKPTDPVPVTELRMTGGEGDDSDGTGRVALGGGAAFTAVVRMDGGRRLHILDVTNAADPPKLVKVERVVYLPPIGKKDPLIPGMLAIAYVAGLRKIGRVFGTPKLTVAIRDPVPGAGTPTITRGSTLTYDVTLTNWIWGTPQRWIELVTGTTGRGDMMFRTVAVNLSSMKQTFEIKGFTHPASAVDLEVQLVVKMGTVTGVVLSDPVPLNVTD